VNEALDAILAQYEPDQANRIELVVVSALAEGADRLVACEVLRRSNSRLEAVLPLFKEDYCDDFRIGADGQPKPVEEADRSIAEFDALVALDPAPTCLHPQPLAVTYPATRMSEKRKKAYMHAGRYVVNHSDALIAIWDGKKARGTGGTAEIIDYARKIGIPIYCIDPYSPSKTKILGNGRLNTTAYFTLLTKQPPIAASELTEEV
jgi:hypothetical protein